MMRFQILRYWIALPLILLGTLSPGQEVQRGMSYTAWWHDSYSEVGSDQSIQNVAAVGANWVSLLVTVYQDTNASTTIYRDPAKTPTDASLLHAIDQIHQTGMKVMLKLHVDCANGDWRGTIDFGADENDWTAWFQNYERIVTDYALLAETAGVEQFCVGTEFRDTEHRETNWRTVISGVKAVYSGPLTYAANHDSYDLINWWDALDFIGVNAYFALTRRLDPTVNELAAAWDNILPDIAAVATTFNRPILFTEIGYRNVDGANNQPWAWGNGGTNDLEEQADCYRAALRAVWNQPWFAGIYWWNWDWNPDYGGTENLDYTPFGKPAADVLRSWYWNDTEVFHVDVAASTNGNGFTWETPMNSLQSALQNAVAGAEIWVAAGSYYPTVGNDRSISFTLAEGVYLYGGFRGDEMLRWERDWVNNETILSGDIGDAGLRDDNSYHVVVSAPDAALDGFTIRDGNAGGPTPGALSSLSAVMIKELNTDPSPALDAFNTAGGGLYITHTSMILQNCRFEQNSADRGGGMYIDNAAPTIRNCAVINNLAGTFGAAVYVYKGTPSFDTVDFRDNIVGGSGGGLYSHGGKVILRDCRWLHNQAIYGGGVYAYSNADLQVECSLWAENLAEADGGAVYINTSAPDFTNCIFRGNLAVRNGGALYSWQAETALQHCTLALNEAGTTGGALYSNSAADLLVNSIAWANTAPSAAQLFDDEPLSIQVRYSCVENAYTGTAVIDTDPLFVDLAAGNLHLQSGSPCIDQGTTGADFTGKDYDGYSRDTLPDLGAFEHIPTGPDIAVSRKDKGIANNTATAAVGDPNHLGKVRIGKAGTFLFTIRNQGIESLVLSDAAPLQITGTDAESFSVGQYPAGTIAENAETEFYITFSPQTKGDHEAWVEISSNDPDESAFRFLIIGRGKKKESLIVTDSGGGCRLGRTENDGRSVRVWYLLFAVAVALTATVRLRNRKA